MKCPDDYHRMLLTKSSRLGSSIITTWMALCALWFWLLNSLIVELMEEEIRFLVLFNTAVTLAPALAAGQWAVWLDAGKCRVTRPREQWVECLSQHYLAASLSLQFTPFFFPPKRLANQWQLCAEEGEYTHLETHTNMQDLGSQWGLGELWEGKKTASQTLQICETLCWSHQWSSPYSHC